jgi:hypothetical protein
MREDGVIEESAIATPSNAAPSNPRQLVEGTAEFWSQPNERTSSETQMPLSPDNDEENF